MYRFVYQSDRFDEAEYYFYTTQRTTAWMNPICMIFDEKTHFQMKRMRFEQASTVDKVLKTTNSKYYRFYFLRNE